MKILIILMLSIVFLSANIGKITGVKGDVSVHREAGIFKGKSGFILELHDKIKTKAKSKALVLFNDKTSITVGKSSSLSVDDFVFDQQTPANSEATFNFGKGVFRTITGKVGKLNPSKFKLKTKSASMGIRGSEAYLEVAEDGSVSIDVLEGVYTAHGKDIPKGTSGIVTSTSVELTKTTPQRQEKIDKFKEDDEQLIMEEIKAEEKEEEEEKTEEKEDKAEEDKEKTDEEEKTKEDKADKKQDKETDNKEKKVEKEALLPVGEDDDFGFTQEETPVIQPITPAVTHNADVFNDITTTIQVIVDEELDDILVEETEVTELSHTKIISDSPVSEVDTMLNNFEDIAKEVVGSDNYMEFGYVLDELDTRTSTYITGSLTSNILIEQYMQNSNTGSYSGDVAALVTDSSGNKISSSGSVNLNMDFGTKNLSGDIAVTEGNWKANVNSGDINSYGFNSQDVSSASDSSVSGISGNIDGRFYGTGAENVGGSFNLESTADGSVSGVFGGSKQ